MTKQSAGPQFAQHRDFTRGKIDVISAVIAAVAEIRRKIRIRVMISSYGTNTDSVCWNVDVICQTLDVTGGTETVHQRNYSRLPRQVRTELKRIKLVIQIRGRRNKTQHNRQQGRYGFSGSFE